MTFSSKLSVTTAALAALGLLALAPHSAQAQTTIVAFDEASNYSNNSQIETLNGGFGFASAFVGSGGGGDFLNTASSNANGSGGGIDSSNNRSFGLYSGSNEGRTLSRSFSAPLTVGGTFSLGFDNGYVDFGRSDNVFLGSAVNPQLIQFGFVGGSDYKFNGIDTGLNYTPDGLNVVFTLTDATHYTLKATELNGGSTFTSAATLLPTGTSLDRFSAQNSSNTNGGSDHDFFVNKFQVTAASAAPEPSQLAGLGFAAFGVLGLLLKARKRTSSPAPAATIWGS